MRASADVENPVLPSTIPPRLSRLLVGSVGPVVAEFRGLDLDLDEAQAAAGGVPAVNLAGLPIVGQARPAFRLRARLNTQNLFLTFFLW